MKTNSAIILISDLHLMSFKVPHTSKTIESKIQDDDDYIECFFDSVKKQLSERSLNLYALVIAGDIANSGKTREYEKAKYFLNKAIEKLGLIKENIILVPGNHDINWTDIDTFIDSPAYNGDKKEFELHEVKFSNFKKFYDTTFDKKDSFECDSSIVELRIDDENNLIILALNSNYYESNCSDNHFGFIKHDKLRELLDTKLKSIQHKNYGKIVVLHHHFNNFLNKNDIQTLTVLNNFGFHAFLHGHVHNDYSNANQDSVLNYFIGVGSFAKKEHDIVNSYKLLLNPLKSEDFNIVTFYYSDLGTPKPYWQEQTDITAIKNFCIKADPIDIDKIVFTGEKLEIEIVNSEGLGDCYSIDKFLTNDSKLLIDNKRIILDEIREKKLFKTGHFHWSDNFRSHGLIDIYTLINSNTTKKLVIDLFIELIKVNNIGFDSIIGVGFEGNIIGSQLALHYPNSNYTYVPNSLEYYNEFEKRIKLENTKIAIIEDVIYKADALELFLKEHTEITDKIEEIELIALFFCGSKHELANIRKIPKVKFNFIFDEITIGSCNYETDINECPIVKNNLDIYYKFH